MQKRTRLNRAAGFSEGKGEKERYSQPPLMGRHNRGDIREKGEKTTQGRENELEREFIQIRQQREINK